MIQEDNSTTNIWQFPCSSPVSADPAPTVLASITTENEGLIEESITLSSIYPKSEIMGDSIIVSSPSLPGTSTVPPNSQSNTSESDAVETNVASPATSSSSLSEPPTEPNSPILFHLDDPEIKTEATEDTISDIASEISDYIPITPPITSRSFPGRGVRARDSGDRGIDPCADPVWVTALRVVKAADQTADPPDDVTITYTRNLRKTSSRLIRARNTSSVIECSPVSPSHNRTPASSKKRSRGHNVTSHSEPVAIKKETLDERDEVRIDSSTEKKRVRRPPRKRQRVAPAVPEPHGPRIGQRIQATQKKKYAKKPTYAYVTERLDGELGEKTRGSVPPSFTFRYALPHTLFELEKEPLRSSRYWSEGAENTGYLEPIGGIFQRKNGLLTDVVCITESRLRPRKSCDSLLPQHPRHRKPERLRKIQNSKEVLEWGGELGVYPDQVTKKRALEDGYDETEESDDDDITVTEYDYQESDLLNKSDEGDEAYKGIDDETDYDLDLDDKGAGSILKMENSSDLEKTPLKKQKLNSSESLSSRTPRKVLGSKHRSMVGRVVTGKKGIDDRIWPGAVSLVDGKYMVPRACENCKEARQFCNRDLPCALCIRKGRNCRRQPGVQLAKPFLPRGSNRMLDNTNRIDGVDSSDDPETIYLQSPQLTGVLGSPQLQHPRPRGRPPKSGMWVKKEVTDKVKRERDIKDVPLINLIDPQEGKPPGIRKPEVWCESRQELCESLPYYRSYQSGCYGHDGLIHGYLLDGFAAPRDYVDGKVVISHSGGKSTADEDGQRRLLTNQTSEDKVIKYLLANMKNQLPLVMIMGTQCSSSPSKLPYRYCVMDWFKVTAGWAERDARSRYTRWKFRFEKLDSTVDGWWAAAPTTEDDRPAEMVKASCNFCKAESPHVYEEGWMCLKPECAKFWTLNGKDAPTNVKYTNNFLHCRTPWPAEFLTPPNPLGPPLNFNRDVFFDGGDVSRIFWKGMCCPKCGRLNCREVWAGWRCLSCDFKFDPPRTMFDAARLADPHRPVFTGPAIPTNICHDDIAYERYIRDGMTVIQYQLGNCGTVTHILANQKTNTRPKDADWLFHEYQSADMPFKRFALGNHKAQGRLLTQQFTFNCGAPYKFIVDVESHPFDKSPLVVSRALEVIHDRVNLVHPEAQFNEVLNVGYFEKQKMDYHDDGEEGLGETVASISLGAPARMRFRVKARYAKERHCWTTRPTTPPPQLKLNELHIKEDPKNDEALELGDEDEDEDLEHNEEVIGGQQPLSPPGKNSKKSSKSRVKLDLCLSHGDVMVMKGRDIQKYWEHSVVPQGLFRIAATARFITEHHPGVLNRIKAEAATATEAEKLADKPNTNEQRPSANYTPKTSPGTETNTSQSRQPLGMSEASTKSNNELLPSSTSDHAIPLEADRNKYGVLELLNNGGDIMSPSSRSSNLSHANELGATAPKSESRLCSGTNTARGLAHDSAPTPPSLSGSVNPPPTQGLPRFATANILHPMDQPIGLDYNFSQLSLICQPLSTSPRQTPQAQLSDHQGIVLPSLRKSFVFNEPSSLEHSGIAPIQTVSTAIPNSHPTNDLYQQEPMHTFHGNNGTYPQTQQPSPDRSRTTGSWQSNPEGPMPSMSDMPISTQINHTIPGLAPPYTERNSRYKNPTG